MHKAIIRKEGKDVTLVSYSYMAIESKKAADYLQTEGISVEFIDIRTLKPLDDQTILNSVKKTGRLVIADGSWKTGSFTAEISARIAEKGFKYLNAPIQRVNLPDVPAPASSDLEEAYYIDSRDIISTIKKLMNYK